MALQRLHLASAHSALLLQQQQLAASLPHRQVLVLPYQMVRERAAVLASRVQLMLLASAWQQEHQALQEG
jgi:hypothetical protein